MLVPSAVVTLNVDEEDEGAVKEEEDVFALFADGSPSTDASSAIKSWALNRFRRLYHSLSKE